MMQIFMSENDDKRVRIWKKNKLKIQSIDFL